MTDRNVLSRWSAGSFDVAKTSAAMPAATATTHIVMGGSRGNIPTEKTELRTIDYSPLKNSSTGKFVLLQASKKYEFIDSARYSHMIEVLKRFQIIMKKKKKKNLCILLTDIVSEKENLRAKCLYAITYAF